MSILLALDIQLMPAANIRPRKFSNKFLEVVRQHILGAVVMLYTVSLEI